MSTRGWYWPWLLAAGLLGVVAVNVVMFFVASSDGEGAVVEPDYYRKAVEWDSTLALRAASARLGWTATASLVRQAAAPSGPEGASAGRIAVRLVDDAGAAVAGAQATAVLIHNADAGHPQQVLLHETLPGSYTAETTLAHLGLWEVRVDAHRAAAHFAAILHTELVAPPAVARR
jgi:nitrogen fixation protein FixH